MANLNVKNRNISIVNSFSTGIAPAKRVVSSSSNIVYGNTNCPERLNFDPNAGEVVTFDSYKCFGFEPTF